MQFNCPSCGAINELQNDEPTCLCSFCGTQIQRKILKENKKKGKLLKSQINNNELLFKNRNITDLSEIIDIYTDFEIEKVTLLSLSGNNLTSLNGISRFSANLNLSNNDLKIIDDFPTLRYHKLQNFPLIQSQTPGIKIDLSNNFNLIDISDNVVNKINSFKNLSYFELVIVGCPKFNFESLSKINYEKILADDFDWNDVEIFVDPSLELPLSLKKLGFISTPNSLIKFGENKDLNVTCWSYRKGLIEFEYISIGSNYLFKFAKHKILSIVEEYKKTNSETAAIRKTIEIYDIPEDQAQKLVYHIIRTRDLFPEKFKENNCFIATASLGDYNHPIVIELRQFRDNWLIKKNWGKKFTDCYYTNGPRAAKIIEKSKLLKMISFYLIVKPLHVITKKLK